MSPLKILSEATQIEYPTICPFSQNNKYILLQHPHGFYGLYSIEGKLIKVLPSEIKHPKWSRRDDKIIYFTILNELHVFNVETNLSNLVHKFDEYKNISSNPQNSESDISRDGIHFIFYGTLIGNLGEIFIYNLDNNRKEFTYSTDNTFDAIRLSSSNQAILSKISGIWQLPNKQITLNLAHSALSTFNNRDVLIYAGAKAKDKNEGAVVLIDIATLQKTELLTFDWRQEGYSVHISTCDKELCLISLFSTTLSAQLWKAYFDGRIEFLYEFDTIIRDYNSQPKASLSRDGNYVVFAIDDGTRTNIWLGQLDQENKQDKNPEIRIDYSSYLEYEFIMRPRSDGAIDIFQRRKS